nr:transposase (putative), gypsy type [Tanacetum cinerariifolium]
CALLRKKFKEDLFTYYIKNGIFQDFQDTSEPSNDNNNVVNALQEPFVVKQDPGKNFSQSPPQINHHCCYGCGDSLEDIFFHQCTCELCGKGAHYGYNCPPKVLIIPDPKPFNNQTTDDLPQTVPRFDPTCYYEDRNSFTYDSRSNLVDDSPNVFDPPPQPPVYSYEFCKNDARYGHYCTPQVPFIYLKPGPHEAYQCQPMNEDYYHEQNSCYNPNSFGFDQFQRTQYTVNHPIFNAQNDLFNSQNKLMEQLTSMCDMVGQYIQKNEEEKRIKEEQAVKDRYWKIPVCYDDDDNEDYTIAITPIVSTEEPDNALSMGDEHLDTILATESDDFIKSSVENLVLIPKLVSLEVMEIVIPEVGGIHDDILLTIKDDILREKLLNINLLIANIEPLKDNPTSSSDFIIKSSSTSLNFLLEKANTFDNSLPESKTFCFDLEEISSGSTTTHFDISLPDYEAFYDDHVKEISSGSTTTHSDSFIYDSFIFDLSIIPFPPASKSDFYHEEFADELTHIISTLEYDCFYFKNESTSGDFTMDVVEDIFPTRLLLNIFYPSGMKIPFLIPTSPVIISLLSCRIDDDSLYNENIEYVEASPHDSELVSLEVAEIVIPEDEEIEDDNLREKLLKVNLLIAKIKALKDNSTPSSEFLTKSSSIFPKSVLEETNTFDDYLPEFENFCFDFEEISSGGTTTHSDIFLLDYEAFSFYTCPSINRSDFTHKEFADELAHIISPSEYECFYFGNFPDPGEWISSLNSEISENLSSITHVNFPVRDDHSPLLAYIVWIFLAYLTYPVIPPHLHSFANEDTIFDPGITINHFYSLKPEIENLSLLFFKHHSQALIRFSYSAWLGHDPEKDRIKLPGPKVRILRSPIELERLFFWVNASVFPLVVSWHSGQTLRKDLPPTPDEFSAEVCDFLADNPTPFRKFPEAFLCLVGISRHYTLDKNCYPTFWDDKDEGGNATDVGVGNDDVNEGSDDATAMKNTEQSVHVGDHGTSRDTSVITVEKYLTALQDLLDKSILAAEIGVTAATTVPFVTSSVTLTPEHEGGEDANSVSAANVRTKHPAGRFVISSDTPQNSNPIAADDKVSSVVRCTVPRSIVSIPAVLTVAVATSVVAGTFISQPREVNEPTRASIFADSTSAGNVDLDAAGPSQPSGNDISSKSFYVSLDMDSEALRHAYLRAMEYDQLFSDFNVGATCQTCLSAEVRMRLEHVLRGKKRLEARCVMQEKLLKEKDVEIADLKARLSLKEAETVEAIRLRGQIADVEAAKPTRACQPKSLKEQNVALEFTAIAKDAKIGKLSQDLSQFQLSCDDLSIKASTFECEKDKLVDQVKTLSDCVAGMDSNLMELALYMDEEFYPRYLTTLAKWRWIFSRSVKLVIMKCLQSSEYMTTLGGAIGHAIKKGIQDGLSAGIDHGQEGRVLADVSASNPSAEANYFAVINDLHSVDFSLLAQLESRKDASIIDIIDLLHLEGSAAEALEGSQLQPSPKQLMVFIHRLEDQVVIRETSLSFSFEVAHNRVQTLRGDATAFRLPLTDAMVLLVEPLSVRSLTAGSESRPPMLNKENYVPWSSRLLRYDKSRPNGKLIHNSIINGPYVRRMIPKPGDTNQKVPVNETFHVYTDDELTEKELKQIEADDQAIQIILLGLPEDIYADVDSCETAQEIWLRVQQMMKGSDIGIQEKKAKLFNEWERLKILYHLWQLPTILTNFQCFNQDQPSFNQNYIQQPMLNPNDITDPITAMNMALALMAKAFKLNYSTPTNNNQRTKKIMETMNLSFDELSVMAFKQRSSKPGLQIMTSGQISSGLDLTYAPSTITTQQPTKGELDLMFEAMYDDFIGGQPSTTLRTVPDAQAQQVHQTSTTSTTIANSALTPTNSSSQAKKFPNTSQDVDELTLQQQHAQQQGIQAYLQF